MSDELVSEEVLPGKDPGGVRGHSAWGGHAADAVDPDIDLHVPSDRGELTGAHVRVLVAIALGGAVGALARYGLATALPTVPGRFPLGTFVVNVVGCALIGVLMVLVTETWSTHHLVRPFLGVGVLGGFTTFSTYANEARGLLRPGSLPVAFAYLAGTLVCALLATLAGIWVTRSLVGEGRR